MSHCFAFSTARIKRLNCLSGATDVSKHTKHVLCLTWFYLTVSVDDRRRGIAEKGSISEILSEMVMVRCYEAFLKLGAPISGTGCIFFIERKQY